MNTDRLPPWTDEARRLLDCSIEPLDAATRSRLHRARQAALAQRRRRSPRPFLLAVGFACAALLAVAVIGRLPQTGHVGFGGGAVSPTLGEADLDIVAAEDGLEFYQDLDFYAWLDAQSREGDG
jgi:hypothetical protein